MIDNYGNVTRGQLVKGPESQGKEPQIFSMCLRTIDSDHGKQNVNGIIEQEMRGPVTGVGERVGVGGA